MRTSAPAVNGKGITGIGVFITAIQISICNIGRTADNDFIVIRTAAGWPAAVNINRLLVCAYRTAADVNSVVVRVDTVWPAVENSVCYFSIAIDGYIAAAVIFIVIAVASAVNIAYCTAGNGETVTIAVNVRIIFADGFTISCYECFSK